MPESQGIRDRDELIAALHTASELEHGLCCLYLFAGFSLRNTLADFDGTPGDEHAKRVVMQRAQRWRSVVFEVARQEMEHLGIVINMLNALGDEPFFWRPDFPLPPEATPLLEPYVLERFGAATLRRFMAFERPDYFTRDLELRGAGLACEGGGGSDGDDPGALTVQQLYDRILSAFKTLPAAELFLGDTRRQVNVADLALGFNVTMEPVTDRASAATAVGLIIEQGEGIGDNPLSPDSHFLRFTRIADEYRQTREAYPDVEPAFDVAPTPLLAEPRHRLEHDFTLVTHPYTRRAMELFNDGYLLMLIMLKRFFQTFTGFHGRAQAVGGVEPVAAAEQKRQNSALLENAFFPFMTMFIRPLGEVLVRLPAGRGDGPPNAGPSFELPEDLGGTIPTFTRLREYDRSLAHLERRSARLAADAPERLRDSMRYLHENLVRMRANFRRVWRHGA